MMLETLIYFRIWAVTVRFARFGCSKLATISRIQQTQKTDAYKKAGGTPIQFHRPVPTGVGRLLIVASTALVSRAAPKKK